MKMWSWWRHWVTHLDQIRSAEFFARPTAARRGRKFYRKMKIPVELMSFSIRIIQTSCSRRSGKRDGNHGFSPVVVRAADYIVPRIMALLGSIWKEMGFLEASSARSVLPFQERILTASMQSSRRKKAAFTVPTMLDSIGPE